MSDCACRSAGVDFALFQSMRCVRQGKCGISGRSDLPPQLKLFAFCSKHTCPMRLSARFSGQEKLRLCYSTGVRNDGTHLPSSPVDFAHQLRQTSKPSSIKTKSSPLKTSISTMAATSQPGVLLLTSKGLDDSAALTGLDFARWGEETCVPSVQTTGGVAHTLRYESLDFMKRHRSSGKKEHSAGQEQSQSDEGGAYDFLDVYFMPDIDFTEREEWRRLPIVRNADIDGNMDASKLLERLLMQTEFQVRLCSEAEGEGTATFPAAPAPFLVTATTSDGWLPDDILNAGHIMGRFQVRSAFTVSAMERLEQDVSSSDEVVLIACNSPRGLETVSSRGREVKLWGLRRQYTGSEREPAAWRPGVRI